MTESSEVVPAPPPMTPLVVTRVPRRYGDRRRAGHGTPVDVGALVALVPEIGKMLHRSDELVRIVGSTKLLDGIKNHSLHYMQGQLGHTTAVLDQHNRIVGHVQLRSATPSNVVAPAAVVFQIASAVTLQYYLQRFDEQLAEISNAVRKAREHAAWAQVVRAAYEAAELSEALQRDGVLGHDLRARLDAEERAVDVVVLQELQPVHEAMRRLQAVRNEIDGLLGKRNDAVVVRTVSILKETLPGGARHRLHRALDELDSAMPHWFIAARAAQVHANLRTLRAVDDQLDERLQTAAAVSGLTERAAVQAALAHELDELLVLPAETYSLFGIDAPVMAHINSVRETTKWLGGESAIAAERLGIATTGAADELLLMIRDGRVVALPSHKTA